MRKLIFLLVLGAACTATHRPAGNPEIASTVGASCNSEVYGFEAKDQDARYREMQRKMDGHLPTWLPDGFVLNNYIQRRGARSMRWTDDNCRRITMTIAATSEGTDWHLWSEDPNCGEEGRHGICLYYRAGRLAVSTFDVSKSDAERVARSVS